MSESCQGYTNWETWSIGNYIDNTREEAARWGFESEIATDIDELAKTMEEYFSDEILPENVHPLIAHFFSAGMTPVNWEELATEYYNEAHEPEEETEKETI